MEEKATEEVTQQENLEAMEEKKLPAEEEYRTLFQTGIRAYENRDFENASKTFLEIHEKFPEQTEALVNYADCQYELLNTEEALKYWNLAKAQDKYLINPYINLGNYYLANEKYKEAIDEYIFAFCLNPHNEMALVNLAVTYEKLNNRKKAFLLYEFYIANNLNVNSMTYKNIHSKIAKHKLNAISQMRLGIYFEKNGYYRKAIQTYFDSLRVFPNFAKTYSNIGNVFFKLEKYDYAQMYWLEAFKIDKKNQNLCLNLALCSERAEDYVNAYAFYSRFLKHSRIGVQERQLAEAALQKCHEAVLANHELVTNHTNKAEEFYESDKLENALVYYENLNVLVPQNEIQDKINKLKTETNLLHKASYISYQMALDLFEKGKYEFAMDKCKMAQSLWKNSYLEQNIKSLLMKCQTIMGNSISNMIKARN